MENSDLENFTSNVTNTNENGLHPASQTALVSNNDGNYGFFQKSKGTSLKLTVKIPTESSSACDNEATSSDDCQSFGKEYAVDDEQSCNGYVYYYRDEDSAECLKTGSRESTPEVKRSPSTVSDDSDVFLESYRWNLEGLTDREIVKMKNDPNQGMVIVEMGGRLKRRRTTELIIPLDHRSSAGTVKSWSPRWGSSDEDTTKNRRPVLYTLSAFFERDERYEQRKRQKRAIRKAKHVLDDTESDSDSVLYDSDSYYGSSFEDAEADDNTRYVANRQTAQSHRQRLQNISSDSTSASSFAISYGSLKAQLEADSIALFVQRIRKTVPDPENMMSPEFTKQILRLKPDFPLSKKNILCMLRSLSASGIYPNISQPLPTRSKSSHVMPVGGGPTPSAGQGTVSHNKAPVTPGYPYVTPPLDNESLETLASSTSYRHSFTPATPGNVEGGTSKDRAHVVSRGRRSLEPDSNNPDGESRQSKTSHVVSRGRRSLEPDSNNPDGEGGTSKDRAHVVSRGRRSLEPDSNNPDRESRQSKTSHVVSRGRRSLEPDSNNPDGESRQSKASQVVSRERRSMELDSNNPDGVSRQSDASHAVSRGRRSLEPDSNNPDGESRQSNVSHVVSRGRGSPEPNSNNPDGETRQSKASAWRKVDFTPIVSYYDPKVAQAYRVKEMQSANLDTGTRPDMDRDKPADWIRKKNSKVSQKPDNGIRKIARELAENKQKEKPALLANSGRTASRPVLQHTTAGYTRPALKQTTLTVVPKPLQKSPLPPLKTWDQKIMEKKPCLSKPNIPHQLKSMACYQDGRVDVSIIGEKKLLSDSMPVNVNITLVPRNALPQTKVKVTNMADDKNSKSFPRKESEADKRNRLTDKVPLRLPPIRNNKKDKKPVELSNKHSKEPLPTRNRRRTQARPTRNLPPLRNVPKSRGRSTTIREYTSSNSGNSAFREFSPLKWDVIEDRAQWPPFNTHINPEASRRHQQLFSDLPY